MKAYAVPAPDLFTPSTGAADADVLAGLSALAARPPLWPVDVTRWSQVLATVTAVAEQALACGWDRVCLGQSGGHGGGIRGGPHRAPCGGGRARRHPDDDEYCLETGDLSRRFRRRGGARVVAVPAGLISGF